MGWQIAATGLLVFLIVLFIWIPVNEIPKWLKMIGGIGFWLIPIGLLVQIWQ